MQGGRLPTGARVYIAGVNVAAVISAAALWRAGAPAIALGPFLVVTAAGIAAHAFPIQASRHQAYHVTAPLIVLAAALFSASQLVAFIVLIHVVEQARLHRRLPIQWFNVCDYFLAAAMAAVFYHHAIALLPDGAMGQVAAAMGAASAFVILNRLLLAPVLWLARGLSLTTSGLFEGDVLAADLVIAWICAPMLVLTLQGGPAMLAVMAGPLLLARPALLTLLARRDAPVPVRRKEAA